MEHLFSMALDDFHPAVRGWFNDTFAAPTPVQRDGWRAIRQGRDTLIAAPTGSGKTLAAFLVAIDQLVWQAVEDPDGLGAGVQVVYVSPLRALSNDIQSNLQRPLAAIMSRLRETSSEGPKGRGRKKKGVEEIRVGLRTGDTSSYARSKMAKNPPHILVSTPESLFILLGSDSGRAMLRNVRTVIVDEIHALTPDRRGAHLSLTLERLQHLAPQMVRIGLSATQRPIELTGRFLVGAQRELPQIIDAGHRRDIDLAVEVVGSPLDITMSHEAMVEVYERLTELINAHTTTLIFTNTRREAERIAHILGTYVGEPAEEPEGTRARTTALVSAHHGALARERRHEVEQSLRDGRLKALVATASLELGIDIGEVDLVCQIGSVKAVSTLLQRVGRSGHFLGGIPKGRIFPMTLDELVEAAALMKLQREGELDTLQIDLGPLDLLAQHIVAMSGNGEWQEDELFELLTRSANFAALSRETFLSVLQMLADGYSTRRGRRGAYIHWDRVNHRVRGRRGARLTALTSGGAIPDRADFQVVLHHDETVIGTLDEDFAIESSAGDIFLLGTNSWAIQQIDSRRGLVRVEDAHGAPPTVPFWLGEVPGRTEVVSTAVSQVRREVDARLRWSEPDLDTETGGETNTEVVIDDAVQWLQEACGLCESAATQAAAYLAATREALTAMPTREQVVVERFFDEADNTHLVIHSPFGACVNRGWGLALRKRFCRSFNFELQAAANEDAILLSMGPTHSFPLSDVFDFLSSTSVREVLVQALLDSPMFGTRWRWNLNRSLAVPRYRGGRKNPPMLQRIQADDLLAVVFPDQLACLENIQGDREVPDHPMVQQTIFDCLHDAMDIDGLEELLRRIERNEVAIVARDVREPSPMSQQIINAAPYAFLDDTPLEERRTRAVRTRGMLDPKLVDDLAVLDTAAVDRVREEVAPNIREMSWLGPDELHDALVCRGYMTDAEVADYGALLEELEAQRRVGHLTQGAGLWFVVERAEELLKAVCRDDTVDSFDACVAIVRSRLEFSGPIVAQTIADELGLEEHTVVSALLSLEASGFVFRGYFDTREPREQWCERTLLARIHRYTLARLRREIEPVTPVDFMRFLFHWQHVSAGERMRGVEGVAAIVEQLSGVEVAAAAWEPEVLSARIVRYESSWLDRVCLSGRFVWGRRRTTAGCANGRAKKATSPVRTSPIALMLRAEVDVWARRDGGKDNKAEHDHEVELGAAAARVLNEIESGGACFFDDLATRCRLLHAQLEDALGELVSAGYVTSDSFAGLRAFFPSSFKRGRAFAKGKRARTTGLDEAGRWALLHRDPEAGKLDWSDADVERVVRRLLQRWGVVVRVIARRETQIGWRRLLAALRTMEARGEVRGGRFVNGVGGEQFALPDALTTLRRVRRATPDGELISISACDPLNLTGVVIGSERVAATLGHRLVWRDGYLVATWDGREVRHLEPGGSQTSLNEVERLARQLPAYARVLDP